MQVFFNLQKVLFIVFIPLDASDGRKDQILTVLLKVGMTVRTKY